MYNYCVWIIKDQIDPSLAITINNMDTTISNVLYIFTLNVIVHIIAIAFAVALAVPMLKYGCSLLFPQVRIVVVPFQMDGILKYATMHGKKVKRRWKMENKHEQRKMIRNKWPFVTTLPFIWQFYDHFLFNSSKTNWILMGKDMRESSFEWLLCAYWLRYEAVKNK